MNATSSGEIRLHLFGRTDVGQVREHNEDNFLIADLTRKSRTLMEGDRVQRVGDRGTVLGVCDGMGGAAAGEVASQLAVDIIYEKLIEGDTPTNDEELARRLVQSVEAAGAHIFSEARADRTRRGMGTTATIAAVMHGRLFVAQVGDSRAYLLRQGKLVQISRDQSLVNQLIEAGQLTEEEAETFEHNNIILQALGTAETVQVDLTYVDLRRGDVLLLCSDGLSGMIRADEIREVLMNVPDPMEACKQLTDRANLAGGHDNVTVIVARFDAGLPEPSPEDSAPVYQKYVLPGLEESEGDRLTPEDELKVPPSLHPEAEPTMPDGSTQPLRQSPPGPGDNSAVYKPDDEPVRIPTNGLPPAVVGVMVLGAMIFVAVAGFYLLR